MGYPNGSCPQADGNTRSYDDYAVTVNPQLHVPQYPIPLPEDVFLKLRGGQPFTKLDFKSAYQQLPLDPESQQFLTINTHRGLYRYKRLPLGIASSPALFQRTMDIILRGLDHVAGIHDDILITGKDDDEHIKILDSVLSRLDLVEQMQIHAEINNVHGPVSSLPEEFLLQRKR